MIVAAMIRASEVPISIDIVAIDTLPAVDIPAFTCHVDCVPRFDGKICSFHRRSALGLTDFCPACRQCDIVDGVP